MAAGSVGGGGDALARAHDGLLRQGDLQFDFALQVPPEPPAWLKALADLLRAAAPLFQWLFWIGLALGAGMVLWFVGRELLAARFPSLRRKPAVLSEPEWRPSAVRARTLLEDADRLAAAGRYGEAAHLILFRSIEDIDQRWPGQLAPALTSRDIGRLAILPALAQQTFAGIAEVVEHSVFGGRPVDAETYAACRGAYQAFALRARA